MLITIWPKMAILQYAKFFVSYNLGILYLYWTLLNIIYFVLLLQWALENIHNFPNGRSLLGIIPKMFGRPQMAYGRHLALLGDKKKFNSNFLVDLVELFCKDVELNFLNIFWYCWIGRCVSHGSPCNVFWQL